MAAPACQSLARQQRFRPIQHGSAIGGRRRGKLVFELTAGFADFGLTEVCRDPGDLMQISDHILERLSGQLALAQRLLGRAQGVLLELGELLDQHGIRLAFVWIMLHFIDRPDPGVHDRLEVAQAQGLRHMGLHTRIPACRISSW